MIRVNDEIKEMVRKLEEMFPKKGIGIRWKCPECGFRMSEWASDIPLGCLECGSECKPLDILVTIGDAKKVEIPNGLK
jgi:hypothetical protein